MANWCNNNVTFTASEENMQALKDLFHDMDKQQQQEQCGQLPSFIQAEKGYFFDIDWDFDEALHYETKWSPNTDILQQIADKYSAEFVHTYEELGCLIYGEAVYENGALTDIFLEDTDFDKYQYLEDKDKWLFEDHIYDSHFKILDILLERKKSELQNI